MEQNASTPAAERERLVSMTEPVVAGMWLPLVELVLLVEDAADGKLLESMMQLVLVSAMGEMLMSKAWSVLPEDATTGKSTVLASVEQAATATGELLMPMVALAQLVEAAAAATGIRLAMMVTLVETASEAVPTVKLAYETVVAASKLQEGKSNFVVHCGDLEV